MFSKMDAGTGDNVKCSYPSSTIQEKIKTLKKLDQIITVYKMCGLLLRCPSVQGKETNRENFTHF